AGVLSQTFQVPIVNDVSVEGDETVNLTLSGPGGGAALGSPTTAVLTIVDNDVAPAAGALQFSSSSYSVNEGGGSAEITVTRTGGSAGSVTVNYATSDGTAAAPSDYQSTSGMLTFGAGVLSQTFQVPIVNDGS